MRLAYLLVMKRGARPSNADWYLDQIISTLVPEAKSSKHVKTKVVWSAGSVDQYAAAAAFAIAFGEHALDPSRYDVTTQVFSDAEGDGGILVKARSRGGQQTGTADTQSDPKLAQQRLQRRKRDANRKAQARKRQAEKDRNARLRKEREAQIMASRREHRQCVFCGRRLTVFHKLLGIDRHAECKTFRLAPESATSTLDERIKTSCS